MIAQIYNRLFKKEHKIITIKIPRDWSNCAVTLDNYFIADTNHSVGFDSLRFPLPKPKYKWNIKGYRSNLDTVRNEFIAKDKWIELIDK